MNAPSRLLLIDGSGFIFRAYHKLPPLTRPDGTPVNAVYGFTTMLLKLREAMHASHAVVVFDAKGKTFRHALYPAYKAHRPPAPEDLIPQFPLVREAASALSFPIIEQEGVEADDIIATYAVQASAAGMDVCIVSSDKDLMQLYGNGVTLFDPLKNMSVTEAEILDKFGVAPAQVIDVQALIGDSSDNIPGIKGIGVKTAAELIAQFGSLEALLDRAAEIPQTKRRELIANGREAALLSRQLVTLKTDCMGLLPLESLTLPRFDAEAFAAFCVQQGFKSLVKKAGVANVGEARPHPNLLPRGEGIITPLASQETLFKPSPSGRGLGEGTKYQLVQTIEALQALLLRHADIPVMACDVETTGLDAMSAELVGVSLAWREGEGYYLPLAHKSHAQAELGALDTASPQNLPMQEALAALKPLLEDAGTLKVGHNIKYDLLVLQRYGITVAPYDDTMLLSYLLGAGAGLHNMDALAEVHLGMKTIAFKEVTGSGKAQVTFDYVPLEAARDYAAEDADVTLRLHHHLKPQVVEAGLTALYERLDRPLIAVLMRMEAAGVKVDKGWLAELSHRFATEMNTLEQEIYALAGHPFTIGSPKQLGEVLFDELALAKGKKSSKTGAYSTDAEVLEELALTHELPAKVLTWRQVSKLKSTYTDALPKQVNPRTGRVHTSYGLAGTTTGRLSSSDPNLQNIPIRSEQGRLIRNAFIAEQGYTLMSADYSQIELRLLAHIADIAPLKEAFKEGRDIHAATAAQMFGVPLEAVDSELRRRAKTINFGIIYGISAHGLATRLGISRTQAAEYIDAYFTQYAGIKAYMERAKEQARGQGYVTTLAGRRVHTPLIRDSNPSRRAFAERAAINAPLQGTAADIIRAAMIAVDGVLQREKARSRMLLQVHDELVFEIASGEESLIPRIARTMEQVISLSIPLMVETGTGTHWGEAH
jgi:DNA polymerase-1